MNYYIRIEKDNEATEEKRDLEINAIELAFKLSKHFWQNSKFKDKHVTHNNKKDCVNKLRFTNFVHVWSLDNIKCMIIKK